MQYFIFRMPSLFSNYFFRNIPCRHWICTHNSSLGFHTCSQIIYFPNKAKKNTIFLIDDILYNYQYIFVMLIEMLYVTIHAYIGKPFPSRFNFLHFITYVTSNIAVIAISAIIIILEIRLIISCTDLSAKPFGILAT